MRRRHVAVVAAAVFVMSLAVFAFKGEDLFAMAKPEVQLGWEWRNGRAIEQRVGLRLVRIKKEGGGFLGIGRSPSLGGSLPDAQQVTAEVVAVDKSGVAKTGAQIGFRIPKVELRGAEKGALVAIGVIGETVVCLAAAPKEVTEADLAGWLPEAPCP